MIAGDKGYPSGVSGAPERKRWTLRLRSFIVVLPVVMLLVGSMASTAHAEGPEATVAFTCKTFTYTFTGFPNVPKNKITMSIRIDGVVTQKATYTFSGPTGSYAFIVNLPPGHHSVDAKASWFANGVKEGRDRTIAGGLKCETEPEYTITKLQKKDGGNEAFTTEQLVNKPHELGQIDYEIVVKNTGNVPLTFSNFMDPKCDEGTITGGPGASPVAPLASTTFFCDHVLTEADKEAGFYTNTATITGEPSGGPPKEQTSNTVEVVLPPPLPGFSIEKKQKLEPVEKPKYPGSGPYTTEVLKQGHVGQVVSYEIIIVNTGNVPLTFAALTDPKCDGGTITGGPGATEVQPGGSTVWHCSHTLTEADRNAGTYTNTAEETGTPKAGDGDPVTHESNTVVVELPKPNNTVEFGCKAITVNFTGFPNMPNNTVTIIVRIDGVVQPAVTFKFNGPSASYTYSVNLSPGHHSLDVKTSWNTNQFKGGRDIVDVGGTTCNAEPAFTVEKLQKDAAGAEPFTTSTLAGEVSELVDYEVIAKNTGNVPLEFQALTDAGCDENTLAGGPGANPVAVGGSTTWTCSHTLTSADETAGKYANSATASATMVGGGGPVTHETNTVLIEPIVGGQ